MARTGHSAIRVSGSYVHLPVPRASSLGYHTGRVSMLNASYSYPPKVAHAVGWAGRWIVTFVCGLLLSLVSASVAYASPLTSSPTLVVHTADGSASASDDSAAAQGSARLERAPARDGGTHDPLDSSDAWLDPDDDDRDDDDESREHVDGGPHHPSVEELLGLTHTSLVLGGSLDHEHTPANQFLADSVRRL